MSLLLLFRNSVAATQITASDGAAIGVSESSSVGIPQFGRPDGAGTVGGTWVGTWADIDEVVPDDLDFIESPANPTATEFYSATLSTLSAPVPGDHTLRFRFAKTATAGKTIGMAVEVRQGDGTIIANLDAGNVDLTTYTQYQYTLTPAEVANITNYEDIRVRLNPTSSGGGASRAARISWLEFEIPPAIIPDLITGNDTAAISVTETRERVVDLPGSETTSLSVDDTGVVSIGIDASDTASLTIVESRSYGDTEGVYWDVLHTGGSNTTDGTTFSLPEYTPAPNRLLLIQLGSGAVGAVAAELPSSVTGNGLTWTLAASGVMGLDDRARNSVYWAWTGSSPTSEAMTINFATAQSNLAWKVIQIGNTSQTPIVQSVTLPKDGLLTMEATLPNPVTTGNAVFTFSNANSTGVVATPTRGYTEINSGVGSGQPAAGTPAIRIGAAYHPIGTQTSGWTYSDPGSTVSKTVLSIEVQKGFAGTPVAGSEATPIAVSEISSLEISDAKTTTDTTSVSVSETSSLEITAAKTASDTTAISVDEIRSRAIVGQENRFTNPSFNDATLPTYVSGTATVNMEVVNVEGAHGMKALKLTAVTSGTYFIRFETVPVSPTLYTHVGGVISGKKVTGAPTITNLFLKQYNSTGSEISSASKNVTFSDTWTRTNSTAVAISSNARTASVLFDGTFTAGDVILLDAVQLTEGTSSTMPAYDPLEAFESKSASETRSLSVAEKRRLTDPNKGTNLYDQLRPDLNTSFEDGVGPPLVSHSSNVATYTTSVVNDATAPDGNKALRVEVTGAGKLSIMFPLVPIEVNSSVTGSVYAKQVAGTFRGVSAYRTTLSTSTGNNGSGSYGAYVTATGSWTRHSTGGATNASAQFANIGFEADATQVGDVFYFDAVQLEYDTLTTYNPINSKDRTDDVALSVSDVGSVFDVPPTGPDLITASETGSIAVSETTAIAVTTAVTDTGAVAISETTALFKSLTASDTSALTVTEVGNVGSTLPGTDSVSLAVAETRTIASTQTRTDTAAVSVAESVQIFNAPVASETNSLTLIETTTLHKSLVASETTALSTNDISNISSTLPGTESVAIAVTETSSMYVTQTGTDTSSVGVGDTAATLVSTSRTDVAALTTIEATTSLRTIVASDTAALSTTETVNAYADVAIPGADANALGIVEQTALFVTQPATDTTSLALTETRTQAVTQTTVDTLTLSVAETRDIGVVTAASDTNSLATNEVSGIGTTQPGADNATLSTTEQVTITVTSQATDTGALAVAEAASQDVTLVATDNPSLTVVETAGTAVTSSATDTGILGLNEISNVASSLPGTETFALGLTEQTSLFITSTRTDTAELSVSEALALAVEVTASDQSWLASTETTAGYTQFATTDSASIAVNELADNAGDDNLPANEVAQISVVEQSYLSITETDDDTAALSVVETSSIYSTRTRADASTLAVSESASIASTVSTTDTIAVAVTEVSNVSSALPGQDTAAIGVAEQASVAKSSIRTDTGGLAVSESVSVNVFVNTSDSAGIAASDTAAVYSGSGANANDVISIALTESTTMAKSGGPVDTLSIGLSETTTLFKTLTANDTAALTVNEVANAGGSLPGAESVSVGLVEETSLFITESRTDALTISVTEAGTVDVLYAGISVNDNVALSVVETSAVEITQIPLTFSEIVASDSTSLTVADTSSVVADDMSVTTVGFVNGEWRAGTAMIYQNGKWVTCRFMIFKNGRWV